MKMGDLPELGVEKREQYYTMVRVKLLGLSYD